MKNIFLSGMMGLVIGDALGVPVEFSSRGNLAVAPVRDMLAYGTYNQPKGTWSDDSSMALATLDALQNSYDPIRMMDNFVAWLVEGEYTPYSEVFDTGVACCTAIRNYITKGDIHTCGCGGEQDNGNGSLMRILPVSLYLYERRDFLSVQERLNKIHEVSALTHAHPRSKIACGLYTFLVWAILGECGTLEERLQIGLDLGFSFYETFPEYKIELCHYDRLHDLKAFSTVPEDDIQSTGYVVHSLEAAVWCLLQTSSYSECVLRAINLGDDTDTTAAIAGGLAGLYYGYEEIPAEWKGAIARRTWIEDLCQMVSESKTDLYRMCDIHAHILPDIDDGAISFEMSLKMLRAAHAKGVQDIFCTSHSWGNLELYWQRFIQLKERVVTAQIGIRIYPGCEIQCSDGWMGEVLQKLEAGRLPTMNGTNYIIAEFEPQVSVKEIVRCTEQLKDNGWKVILAHAERYSNLSGGDSVSELLALGTMLQINAYSLVEETDPQMKARAQWLLEKHYVTFLGSDTHRTDHRPPAVNGGIKYVYTHCDGNYAQDICYRNAERLLFAGTQENNDG